MVADQTKFQRSAAPPRTLNVQKFAESRAAELVSLHSVVKNRLDSDFRAQRNKRRRATGHDNRFSRRRHKKKQKFGETDDVTDGGVLAKDEKKGLPPRRVRRRIELKKNPPTGFSASGDGTKRLRTHVWHAKRFTIDKLWGFYLPIGRHGRLKGSRAILKKSKQGVSVHDASYYGVIQLDGPEDLLLSVLSYVLVPFPSGYCEEAFQNIISGRTYGSAMLHHVGPLNSQSIAPVTYIWRSQKLNSVRKVGKIDDCDEQQSVDNCALRQLWLWIHPSAFREGYGVLESECERLKAAGHLITCMSLEGKLAKLELIGSRAFELIRKIFHPITSVSMDSCALHKCSAVDTDSKAHLQDTSGFFDENKISMSAIISLMVNDPRVLVGKSHNSEPTYSVVEGSNGSENERNTLLDGIKVPKMGAFSSLFPWPDQSYQSLEFADLWDARNGILPPLEESIICKEKYRQSLKLFGVAHRNLGRVDASQEIPSSEYSQKCPLMLLKDNLSDRFSRWSIILPLTWVKVFWIAIVFNGAQAIGLRERHWIAREAGLPCFPSDFPDTKAYSCLIEVEEAVKDKKAKLRPPSLRPLRVLTLPRWEQFQSVSQTISFLPRDTNVLPVTDLSLKTVYYDTSVLGCDVAFFNGFVARTSCVLIHSLAHFGGNNLFLPSKVADGRKWLPKVLKDEKISELSENGVCSDLKSSQNLCFTRVHLCSYREGVFEEGAIVCAPLLNDLTLLTTRSEDGSEKCQIPQSLLSSCSDQQPARIMEFQLLEDSPDSEFIRRSIGFVTTGFVQGSKKPTATAICEAAWLAHLRDNQWKNLPKHQGRKEIYVLVRNLRSTAYRLALATIVLETKEDDLEFV